MSNRMSIEVSPLRSLIDQYLEAWAGGVPEEVLSYFSEDAEVNLGTAGTLSGKKMVAEKWVIPMVMNYPGNTHHVKSFLEAGDQVAVEWVFTGAHAATGNEVAIKGCSIYWFAGGLIKRGHVYVNSPPPKREPAFSALENDRDGRLNQGGLQASSNF
ncbi:MAG: nuclear transport factor 2 family protein [Terriglobales bacterium]